MRMMRKRERVQRAIGIMSHLKRVPPKNSPQILFSPSPGSTNYIKVGKMATFKVGEMATFRAAVYFGRLFFEKIKSPACYIDPSAGNLKSTIVLIGRCFIKHQFRFFLASTFFRHETKKL